MSLNARERQTLGRTASEIMTTAPELATFFSMFNRVESGAELPYRSQPAPSRSEQPCGIMAMTPLSTPVVFLPVRGQRRMLLIIVSALISVGLIAAVVVVGLVGHGTAGLSQNPSWRVGTQQG